MKLSSDLQKLKTMTKNELKNIVKKQSQIFAFEMLREKQEGHSKMKNLHFSHLKMSKYLTNPSIKSDQARILFKFRTGMAPFGQNFRGLKDNVPCPMCYIGLDTAEHAWKCNHITGLIRIECNFNDIYNDDICHDVVLTANKIIQIRENILKKQ